MQINDKDLLNEEIYKWIFKMADNFTGHGTESKEVQDKILQDCFEGIILFRNKIYNLKINADR